MERKQKYGHALTSVLKVGSRLLPLLLIGVGVVILLPKISTLKNIVSVLRGMSYWMVGLAVTAQICSYMGSGYLLQKIMSDGRKRFSILRGALITMASASLGLVAGGWISSSVATYFWVSKGEDHKGRAFMAGLFPAFYNTIVLTLVTLVGMANLLMRHELSSAEFTVYGVVLATTVLFIVLVFFAFFHQKMVVSLGSTLKKWLMHIIRRKTRLDEAGEWVDQFYQEIKGIKNWDWVTLSRGSVINIIFDMLTLYLFFDAAGYHIRIYVLVAGYSLVFLIGRIAFFVPGGIGVIEGGMAAIFMSLGVPNHYTVVAVLGYRLVSFWLPLIFGFMGMVYLQRTSGYGVQKNNRKNA